MQWGTPQEGFAFIAEFHYLVNSPLSSVFYGNPAAAAKVTLTRNDLANVLSWRMFDGRWHGLFLLVVCRKYDS